MCDYRFNFISLQITLSDELYMILYFNLNLKKNYRRWNVTYIQNYCIFITLSYFVFCSFLIRYSRGVGNDWHSSSIFVMSYMDLFYINLSKIHSEMCRHRRDNSVVDITLLRYARLGGAWRYCKFESEIRTNALFLISLTITWSCTGCGQVRRVERLQL